MNQSSANGSVVNSDLSHFIPDPTTAYLVRRYMDGQTEVSPRESISAFYVPPVDNFCRTKDFDKRREILWDFIKEEVPDPDLRKKIGKIFKEAKRPKGLDEEKPKFRIRDFAEAAEVLGEMVHLWKNWLIVGDLNSLCSQAKVGKSRFYLALMKCLWFGHAWPDGVGNPWPEGSKTAIMAYDKNHLEIHRDMDAWGIPRQAAVNVSDPNDPAGLALPDLRDRDTIDLLDRTFSEATEIRLLVVDTLTYATTSDLCKPADMMMLLNPVIEVCKRHRVAALTLIHESGNGQPYGLRIKERARILMCMARYNREDDQKVRVWVDDGNFPTRPALTMWHEDHGVRFTMDEGPVAREGKEPKAQTRQKGRAFGAWLQAQLEAGPVAVKELVDQARLSGYLKKEEEYEDGQRPSISPLYDAKKLLERQGVVFEEFKDHRNWTSWRIPAVENVSAVSEDPSPEDFGIVRNSLPKHDLF